MNPEPVVLINAFEVPEGQDEVFLQGWDRARVFLRTQEGDLSARLHRSIAPSADFRFVNFRRSLPYALPATLRRLSFAGVGWPLQAAERGSESNAQ